MRTEMQKLRWDTEIKMNEILTEEQVEKYLELRQDQRDRMSKGKFRGGKMHGAYNKTPEQVIERLSGRLNLTEEQAVEITPIIQESIEKKRLIFDKYGAERQNTRQAMRAEMQTVGDETEAELSTLLTDEQMEDLRTFRDQKRARMDKRMNRTDAMGF